MTQPQPRPGDLWFRESIWIPKRLGRVTEVFVLVTESWSGAWAGLSPEDLRVAVHTVLLTENVRCLGSGRILESRLPQPRIFYPIDFEKFELLSRCDKESGEEEMTCP